MLPEGNKQTLILEYQALQKRLNILTDKDEQIRRESSEIVNRQWEIKEILQKDMMKTLIGEKQ